MEVGFDLFGALAPLGLFRPRCRRPAAVEAPGGDGALRFGRLFETYPDAVFCALLGHRPPAKRTPWGLQQRIAALRLRGVVDEDGGLWHRSSTSSTRAPRPWRRTRWRRARAAGSATRARA